ncbi:DeoR/GlpR family DNA-binding transcription regulator [Gordonia humi]|uniref:DeoR/GlpR family transcriptional regulator of sugar metabolism n=1 Tax=Gordonia humi TaxID=686429 RepID=A0A840F0R2_9ACTN|nr:DeoR/GlpR family DNA-binding transcription regulator [Gordonia humi]MBB4134909.1 DeoR/GlpR family transcriptional regulator of sugar metabolism [Gordonia humi]
MSADDRRQEILRRLQIDGYVEATALSKDLGVDASTIRRDLDALDRSGRAERTHGGARPPAGAPTDIPYAVKEGERRREKVAIARTATADVRDGQTVVLDSGSTTYQIALELRHKQGLTIITNDLRIGKYAATLPSARLLVTGGELLGSVYTLVGERAVDFMGDYSADWAFMGADALDPIAGITNTNTLEIPIKRAMIRSAERAVVVADSSKFGNRALAKVAAIDEVSKIITDRVSEIEDVEAYGDRLSFAE